MKMRFHRRRPERGFALVVTITLVAMVTLLVVALALISRVEIQAQANVDERAQARRNALFSLQLAVGQLQRYAAGNDIVTLRGDYNGTVVNSSWCGVFSKSSGAPLVWLVNGAEQGAAQSIYAAAPAPNLLLFKRALTDVGEYVTVSKSEIKGYIPALAATGVVGRYAYWVSDESLKVSLGVRTDLVPPAGYSVYPAPRVDKVFPTWNLTATNLLREKLVVTDQALLVASLNATLLNANWEHVTACSKGVSGPGVFALGAFNVNSRSAVAWAAVLGAIDPDASYGTVIGAIIGLPRPFADVDDFVAKLGDALGNGGLAKAQQIRAALAPVLTVRGDTFFVRAYGETVNPLFESTDSNYIRSTAMCEAMVQRTITAAGVSKFVVTYLRWLGPDDI